MRTWDDFKTGIDSRFFLPLNSYVFSVQFLEFNPISDQLAEISQRITAAVVEAVRSSPDPSLYAITSFEGGNYYNLAYGDPTYGFQVELGKTAIVIAKHKCSLEEFVLSLPVIQNLGVQLFSSSSRFRLSDHEFFRLAFRTNHQFNQNIVLGPRLSDPTESPTNLDVMKHFYNYDDSSAVGWLQPESISRTDIEISTRKMFAGRVSNIWMTVQAPYNASQRDMTFSMDLRRDVGHTQAAMLSEQDFLEFEEVTFGFFRDIVLGRIYKNIFRDISILPSVR